MGKRGPKPKPTALRVLEGNPGRLPLNPDEIVIGNPPVKPSAVAMDPHASAEWDRLLHAMPPDLYTAADASVLSQYALAWSMLIRAQQELDERGLMVERVRYDKDGNILGEEIEVNPAAKAWKLASETLLKTGDRLGLNPGVRARLQVPSRGEEPKSKWSGLVTKA